MTFRTIVDLPKPSVALTPVSRVVLLGSCFAENVGHRLAAAMPRGHVDVNPFGVLYNPESIRHALEILFYGSLFFPQEYIFQGRDTLFHSWMHSGTFSAPTAEECAKAILGRYEPATALIKTADVLIVTFGTSHTYLHRQQGYIVSNCHKEPATDFQEQLLTTEAITEAWGDMLSNMERERPTMKIIFTISPYRYAKYGMHESNLAKATLLLAVDRLCQEHKNACYFPAYEIVTDELRDYRFYDADMLHPSAQAADYVFQRFAQWTFSPEMEKYAKERDAITRAEAHRPLHPDSEEYRLFQEKLQKKKDAFQRKWKTSL